MISEHMARLRRLNPLDHQPSSLSALQVFRNWIYRIDCVPDMGFGARHGAKDVVTMFSTSLTTKVGDGEDSLGPPPNVSHGACRSDMVRVPHYTFYLLVVATT